MERYIRAELDALAHFAARQVNEIPDFDPRAGNHYWITMLGYHIDPGQWQNGQNVTVDETNLALVRDPHCYYCQQPYSQRMSLRRCKGES